MRVKRGMRRRKRDGILLVVGENGRDVVSSVRREARKRPAEMFMPMRAVMHDFVSAVDIR